MPYYCTVPRCTSMAGKAKNVSFHQFPRDEELAKLWNRILKRGKPYTKYSKVCSLHFKPEDYTITSVGKNKGQWRTLRKDAVPSQNLPSESPTPYARRSPGCWAPAQPSLDPLVQQQMAQAIYMQTMLAMQSATAAETHAAHDQPLQMPEPIKPSPSGSSLSEIELLLRRDTDTAPKDVTYKCQECSKCFKDPDVFLLHKRTHKNTNNIEKENYSTNIQDREETLRANPILANLLKSTMRLEPESSISNILSVENQIMTALASNMEAYIRTLTSMLSNQTNTETESDKCEERSDDESDCEEETNEGDGESKVCEENEDMCVDTNDTSIEKRDDGLDYEEEIKCEENEDMCLDKNEMSMNENENINETKVDSEDISKRIVENMTCDSQNDTTNEKQDISDAKNVDEDCTMTNSLFDKPLLEDQFSNDCENENAKSNESENEINHENYKSDLTDNHQNDTHKTDNHTNDEDINDSVINKNYKTSDDKTGAKSEVDDNKSDEMLDDDHRKPSDDKHDDIGETSKVCESNDDNGKLVNTDCDSTVDKVPLNC